VGSSHPRKIVYYVYCTAHHVVYKLIFFVANENHLSNRINIGIPYQGWAIISDNVGAIEMARTFAAQVRWEARVIDPQNGSDQRLLVCQKPFLRK